ncbi:myb-like protein A [Eupeodes corollae]|uniref:myb-like protein A n=1 Tax=Eupeodes corollae TaxID=290404 RepID=UPI0024929E54|nr:myb-like protein A [Eupeodes corollae]
MTNESSSMTMKSDNESKLVNTTITSNNNIVNNNNNNIYYTCSSSNKLTTEPTTLTVAATATATSSASASIVSDLPSITLAPFAKIKREAEFNNNNNNNNTNSNRSSSMVMKSSANINNNHNHNSQVPTNSNNNNNNTVSAKMGSRRIFTPQFKLQVLESYRNDADCKGNQRATARKYNIHRRQIQKWLQCESNLRSSVANICANNVKHQFHNITHHQMPIVTNSTLPLPSSAAAAASSLSIHSNNNQQHHHHHHAHHNQQQYKAINNRLSLDTTRHSVALTSIQIPTTKGVLAAAAAAQAAANKLGDVVGAVAPLSSSSSSSLSPSSTAFLSTSTGTTKSLRAPTSPVLHSQILTKSSSSSLNSAMAVSPSKGGHSAGAPLHAYHHHESMGIHTPPASLSSVPVSVPIITPHPHTHLHVANLKIHHYQHLHMEQHQHHHHHNLHHPYNQVQLPPPPHQSSERRPFMPSASLPALPTSSSSSSSSSSFSTTTTSSSSPPASTPLTAVALSCTDTLATNPASASASAAGRVALSLAHVEENRIDELRDYRATSTENRYMNENEYAAAVQSRTLMQRAYEGFHYLPFPMHMYPAAATMIAPIDLSLGTKRLGYSLASPSPLNENNNVEQHHATEYTEALIKYEKPSSPKSEDDDSQLNVVDSDISESSSVVDLTLRKRKVLMPISEDVTAEKHTKVNESSEKEKPASSEPAKPFKLFKPYLLDDEATKSSEESSSKICKQKDPIIWSHHTACLSPPISVDSLQSGTHGSNFQSPPVDATYPFPAGSPTFQSTNAPLSAGFRCPKGSPVSGYESSSSIYSDSVSSNSGDISYNSSNNPPHHSATTSYCFDIKVHNINGDLPNNHLISPTPKRPFIADECIPLLPPSTAITHNHVQRWLDQESGIRQGIALYV